MPNAGRFEGGTHYIVNPAAGTGINITSITPASTSEVQTMGSTTTARTLHGTMGNDGIEGVPGGTSCGYDSGVQYTSLPLAYSSANNIDPGVTGVPINIPPGVGKCLIKSVSRVWDSRDALLDWRLPLFIVPTTPASDALPPGVNSPTMESRLSLSDINMALHPSLTPVASTPSASSVLSSWRWAWQNQHPSRPQADRLTGARFEPQFRRDAAKLAMDAMLLACLNIDADIKKYLRVWTVIHAEDICESLERGIRFNNPQSDGGVQNGRKPIVVMAALLTGDARFESWAQRTDWAIEDAYVRYVTAEMITRFGDGVFGVTDGFLPEDEGIPWWFAGPTSWNNSVIKDYPIRTFWRRSYQNMFHAHMVGAHALAGIFSGYKAMWNNQAIWDYCDRMHYRTLYDGTGTVAKGLEAAGQSNTPSVFAKNMFLAHGAAAVWDWPP